MPKITKDQLTLGEIRDMSNYFRRKETIHITKQERRENDYLAGYNASAKALTEEIAKTLRKAAEDFENLAKE